MFIQNVLKMVIEMQIELSTGSEILIRRMNLLLLSKKLPILK